jgi:cyclopropane fatty-acyl-phospholipid synthase-like methyltransferase
MLKHLANRVAKVKQLLPLQANDVILDIGSNDGSTLGFYGETFNNLIGIDPSAKKFQQYYPKNARWCDDFFSAKVFREKLGLNKARVVTSFSMFYDLPSPLDFVREVKEILADDGVWVFEQSYMPTMLETNSYDTVCHEHLEYYSLQVIEWICQQVGFKIIDIEFNDVNGGSFAVTVSHQHADFPKYDTQALIQKEREQGIGVDERAYQAFHQRIQVEKNNLLKLLGQLKADGKRVYGLGASTKGNVTLQYSGIDESLLEGVFEVNPDKFGAYTPGSLIPIVSEDLLDEIKPDYLLVLPWHFKQFFLKSEKLKGRELIFPLPEVHIVKV